MLRKLADGLHQAIGVADQALDTMGERLGLLMGFGVLGFLGLGLLGVHNMWECGILNSSGGTEARKP